MYGQNMTVKSHEKCQTVCFLVSPALPIVSNLTLIKYGKMSLVAICHFAGQGGGGTGCCLPSLQCAVISHCPCRNLLPYPLHCVWFWWELVTASHSERSTCRTFPLCLNARKPETVSGVSRPLTPRVPQFINKFPYPKLVGVIWCLQLRTLKVTLFSYREDNSYFFFQNNINPWTAE